MKDDIEKFLAEEGYKPLDKEEFKSYFRKLLDFAADPIIELVTNQHLEIDQSPFFYDLFLNQELPHHITINFLDSMVSLIEKLRLDHGAIVDAGCATGREIAYLAKHFQNTGLEFEGFEIKPGMIHYAKNRRDRLGLESLDFYVDCIGVENRKNSADLLYAKSIFKGYLTDIAKTLMGLSKRVKPGGHLLIACITKAEGERLDSIVSSGNMQLVESTYVTDKVFPHAYNHLFKVN